MDKKTFLLFLPFDTASLLIANILGHHGEKVLCKPSYGKWRTRFNSKRFYQFFTCANSRLFRAYFKEFISELFVDTLRCYFFPGSGQLNSFEFTQGLVGKSKRIYIFMMNFFTLLSSAFLKNAEFVCSLCVVRNKKKIKTGPKLVDFDFQI